MYLVKKGNAPNQAHVGIPDGLHEEEHGRRGFNGPSSHLYRTHPPTGWVRIDGPLRPRAFACATLSTPDQRSADAKPIEILRSPDVRVFLSRRAETMPYFVRNADGDEVQFVHSGRGRFETDYGMLSYEPGDYVVIPKGTTYRISVEAGPSLFLIAESPKQVTLPERGLRHAEEPCGPAHLKQEGPGRHSRFRAVLVSRCHTRRSLPPRPKVCQAGRC